MLLSFLSHPIVLKILFFNAGFNSCAVFIAWVYYMATARGNYPFQFLIAFSNSFQAELLILEFSPETNLSAKFYQTLLSYL